MMKQYMSLKGSLPKDTLLAFRLGDFYEMFFEDATTAAPLLNVALTKRNNIPMAGFPHHSAQQYISMLVAAGKQVAVAEQMEAQKPGELVERKLVSIQQS